LIEEVKKVGDARSNVLVLEETRLGKELFARAIHFSGSRRRFYRRRELQKGTFFKDVASLLHREMKGGAKQLMKGGLWKVLR
jgi:DNA-binding NtrC family response regulator